MQLPYKHSLKYRNWACSGPLRVAAVLAWFWHLMQCLWDHGTHAHTCLNICILGIFGLGICNFIRSTTSTWVGVGDTNAATIPIDTPTVGAYGWAVPILGNFEDDEDNSIVLMDNAVIHMSPRVKQLNQAA